MATQFANWASKKLSHRALSSFFGAVTTLHGRSQPKTWGGVELELEIFDFTIPKLAHY